MFYLNRKIGRCAAILILCALCPGSAALAGRLVLKNGRILKCEGPYVVKGNKVEYKDTYGNVYFVSLAQVDMGRSSNSAPRSPGAARKVKKKENPPRKAKKNNAPYEKKNKAASSGDHAKEMTDDTLDNYYYNNPGYTGVPNDSWRGQSMLWGVQNAIDEDNMDDLEKALVPRLDLDKAVSDRHEPVLHTAVNHGNSVAARLLLQAGANPNLLNKNGDTPLIYALKKNTDAHRQVAVTLLKGGANPDARDSTRTNPLHLVLQTKNTNLLAALIDHKVNLNVRDPWGDPPLISAIRNNDSDSLRMMISAKVDLFVTSRSGSTPLLEAVKSGNPALAQLLVRAGADANLQQDGLSPLMLAVGNNDIKMAQKLIDLGARTALRSSKGESAASIAVRSGQVEMLGLLNQHELDVNTPPLLPLAVKGGSVSMVRSLLAQKADPNSLDPLGEPVLVLAARAGKLEIVEALLASGADVYLKGQRGISAYMEASGPHAEAIKAALRTKFKK